MYTYIPDVHRSGMALVAAQAHIILNLENERNHLIASAGRYCYLAEQLQTTNRHLRNEMHDDMESIWQNCFKE